MVTPKDIQVKKFGSSVRGYNKREVDEFLDAITIDYQNVLEERTKLRQENEDLKARLEESQKNEHSVMNTLEQAKRLMSDISESAEKRAEVIIKNAHLDAQTITRNARDSVMTYTEQSEQMKNKLASFRTRFQQFMTEEMGRMDSTVEELFADLGEIVPDMDELDQRNRSHREAAEKVPEAPVTPSNFTTDDMDHTRVFTMPESNHETGSAGSDHTMVFGRDELKKAAESNDAPEKYNLDDLFGSDVKVSNKQTTVFSEKGVTDEFGTPSDAMIDGKPVARASNEPDTSQLKDAPVEPEPSAGSRASFNDRATTVVMDRDELMREFEQNK